MKISKIFAGMSAAAVAVTMSLTAFAGSGTINSVPEGWSGSGSGLAKGMFVGDPNTDTLIFGQDAANRQQMSKITTVKVTISDPKVGTEGYGITGSLVLCSTNNGWDQHDWHQGAANGEDDTTNEDNNVTVEEGAGTVTITFTNPNGVFEGNDFADDSRYYGIAVQNFGGVQGEEEIQTAWDISGYEILDANGNAVTPVAPSDDNSSGTDNNSSNTDNNSSNNNSSNSSNKNNNTANNTNKSNTTGGGSANKSASANSQAAASQKSAETGATAGLALAGLAIAGAAVIITKKNK